MSTITLSNVVKADPDKASDGSGRRRSVPAKEGIALHKKKNQVGLKRRPPVGPACLMTKRHL